MEGQEELTDDVAMSFVGNIDAEREIGSLEPSVDDFVSELLLNQMGFARKYRREASAAAKRIVSELYSPPRVTKLLRETGCKILAPGFAFDLTVVDPDDGLPWDFSLAAKREKARRMIREQRPYFLIGSPMCTAFSTWQALNAARGSNIDAMTRAKAAAILHLDFVSDLYREQLAHGHYFLHRHRAGHARARGTTSTRRSMPVRSVHRPRGSDRPASQ